MNRCPNCGYEVSSVLTWGRWTLDMQTRTLNSKVRLEHQIVVILGELIRAEGGIVSKEKMIQSLYGDNYRPAVPDNSIATRLSLLRRLVPDIDIRKIRREGWSLMPT